MKNKTKHLSGPKAPSRRNFLKGAGAIVGGSTLGVSIAPNAVAGTQKTLIYIFLRGGMDGLSLFPIVSGPSLGHYQDARDDTLLDINDTNTGNRPLIPSRPFGNFGMHPFCSGFRQLYDAGNMAVVMAAGHPPGTRTRSHFDAQEQIELGTPGVQASSEGWIARHLGTTSTDPNAIFTAIAASSSPPISLAGWPDVATLESPRSFHPNSGTYDRTHLEALKVMYSGTAGDFDLAGAAAVDAVELVNAIDFDAYSPSGGVSYPNTGIGRNLELVASLIDQNLGVTAATIDRGGWDTHNIQNNLNQFTGFGENIMEVSDAVNAFYNDMAGKGRGNDVAIVIQSEFGRQIKENANRGTDHGLGNPMVVVSGNVIGGRYGTFPGIAPNQRLNDSLEPTTDFRQVLATVVDRLLDNPNVNDVFPDSSFIYSPLGFA